MTGLYDPALTIGWLDAGSGGMGDGQWRYDIPNLRDERRFGESEASRHRRYGAPISGSRGRSASTHSKLSARLGSPTP